TPASAMPTISTNAKTARSPVTPITLPDRGAAGFRSAHPALAAPCPSAFHPPGKRPTRSVLQPPAGSCDPLADGHGDLDHRIPHRRQQQRDVEAGDQSRQYDPVHRDGAVFRSGESLHKGLHLSFVPSTRPPILPATDLLCGQYGE